MGELLRQGLEEENHTAAVAHNGLEGLHAAQTCEFDAIVLDVMMPGMGGFELARKLRAAGRDTPILMLTARDSVADIVKGLDAGADDYLTKPFALKVLLARLRALARRAPRPPVRVLEVGDLVLDPASREVRRGGAPISLTNTEFRLLEFLMRRPGRAVSRSAIIEAVWGFDEDVEDNTVDAFIRLIRGKIDAAGRPRLLHTVRGYGYILREDS